ncbi:MAG TPA: MCP four helix bundle domain-containing protein, partial [Bacteroidota bacterium]|nr:MCP four helix bundle domain-containing protein [Bacteroidota bacterium]
MMKWFLDLKISTKLLSAFVLVASIAGLIGWVGFANLKNLAQENGRMYTDMLEPLRDLGYVNAAVLTARGDTRNVLGGNSKAEREKFVAVVQEQSSKADEYFDRFAQGSLSTEEREIVPKFLDAWRQYRSARDRAIELALNMKDAEAKALLDG